MKTTTLAAAFAGVFMTATAAGAQTYTTWTPGVELRGHSANVEVNGITNTVTFENDGTARILSATGMETRGQWFAQNNQLCLQTATARECWPYQQAFQAGMPVTLTSDCGSTARWTPISAGQQVMPTSGERG